MEGTLEKRLLFPSNHFLRLKVTEVFQVSSVPSKNPQETSHLEETIFQKRAKMCFVDR